jgi:hypothetical protein
VRRVLIALPAALLLAGCGSPYHPPRSPGGQSLAPSSTALFLRVDTSFDSPQWRALQTLGLPMLQTGDLRRALGRETDLVGLGPTALDSAELVGLTQPPDPTALDALLSRQTEPLVSELVGGWRAVARDRSAIDRLREALAGGTLVGNPAYREATAGLPGDALVTGFADGPAVMAAIAKRATLPFDTIPGLGRVDWAAGTASAVQHGIALDLRVKADRLTLSSFAATLPAQIPGDVVVYVGFHGLDAALGELKSSPLLSSVLGSNVALAGGVLDPLIGLFKGEGALYVRAPAEVTLVLKVADEAAAAQTLSRLATIAGALTQQVPQSVTIGGVSAKRLTIAKHTLYYAVFGGKVVVSTAASGIADLQTGPRLAGSPAWREAAAAAAMPAEAVGFLYLNAPRLAAAPQLAHLGPSLAWASAGGGILTVKGFVSLR